MGQSWGALLSSDLASDISQIRELARRKINFGHIFFRLSITTTIFFEWLMVFTRVSLNSGKKERQPIHHFEVESEFEIELKRVNFQSKNYIQKPHT
jgi:hypothetical protein